MTLKIEFSTVQGDGPTPSEEAGALMALLVTLYPDAGDAAVAGLTSVTTTQRLGEVELSETRRGAAVRVDLTPADLDGMSEAQRAVDDAEAMRQDAAATAQAHEPAALTAEQAFGAPQFQAAAPASSAQAPAATDGPAAPATAPAPPTTAGPAASDAVERDSEGLPWHAEIHSSNRKKSANGRWMKRRGVNQLVEQRVRAELLAANTARTVAEVTQGGLVGGGQTAPVPPPPPASAPIAPPPPPASTPAVAAQPIAAPSAIPQPTASAATPDSGANTGNIAPAPPIASPSSPPTYEALQATAAASPATPDKIQRFAAVMTRVSAAEKAGTLTPEQRDGIRDQCGLKALVDLMRADDDTFAAFDALLTAHGG